jgi:hypothetical protein
VLDIIGFGFKSLATTFIITSSNLRTLIALISGLFEWIAGFLNGTADAELSEIGKEISDIWSDAGTSIGQTWKSSADASKDFEEELKRIKAELANEDAIKAADKLAKEWEKALESMAGERAKSYMNETALRFYQIEQRADAAIAKFKSIPGAVAKINEWAQAMRIAAVEAEKLAEKSAIVPKISAPKSLDTIDTTATDEFYKKRLEQSIEVTDAEMANMALTGEAGVQMYANMGNAMEQFYNLTGQRSMALFVAMKAFKVTEIAMSTYSSIMAALEPPPVGLGPVWGIPFAVSVGAMGAANIASVLAAQPGTGMNGAQVAAKSAMGSGSSYTSGGRSSDDERPQNIEVHIHTTVFDQKTWDDVAPHVIKAINNGTRRGYQLQAAL